jgi:hypothetical protein
MTIKKEKGAEPFADVVEVDGVLLHASFDNANGHDGVLSVQRHGQHTIAAIVDVFAWEQSMRK